MSGKIIPWINFDLMTNPVPDCSVGWVVRIGLTSRLPKVELVRDLIAAHERDCQYRLVNCVDLACQQRLDLEDELRTFPHFTSSESQSTSC